MRVSTDDEIYRVNSVWLGPPGTSWPFRARYVAWGVGIGLSIAVFAVLRQVFPLSLFTVGWALLIAVGLTTVIVRKIDPERPLRAVTAMAVKELNTPRRPDGAVGGATSTAGVRVRPARPRPAAQHQLHPQTQWPGHREEVFRA